MVNVAPRRITETRAILQAQILGVPVAQLYHPELFEPAPALRVHDRLPGLSPSGVPPLIGPGRGPR